MDRRRAADAALDLIVFAPLGLVIAARDVVPELAARGRTELQNQARTACMIGKLATRQGCREAEKRLGQWWPRPPGRGSEAASPSGPDTVRVAPPAPTGAREPTSSSSVGFPSRVAAQVSPEVDRGAPADTLAIPSYDTLSASQVVSRLPGLTPEELEAIRSYEASGRARRTVLTRIGQLRGASPSA